MRICFCLSYYQPIASGAERQAHRQARELVRRGHSVIVITREVAGAAETESIDGVTVRRIIRPRQLGPAFGLTFVSTLARALRRFADEIDLVHCHQALWEAVATGICRKRLGCPTVVQPAAGGPYGEVEQLGKTRGRSLLRPLILRNDHFVAISEQIEQELKQLGVPDERLTRVASGVDVDEFSPGVSTLESTLPPRPRVLFLGRLHPQKNLPMLLEAWRDVRARVPASLILAGDGPERLLLTEHVGRLQIGDSVHFASAVTQVVDYLRAADVFVLPSIAEGMSNSLLEAMAAGVPVIVSRIGGNVDLARNGAGHCVDPSDRAAWSEAIVRTLVQPDESKGMATRARDLVVAHYSIERVVDRYVQLYDSLLGRR